MQNAYSRLFVVGDGDQRAVLESQARSLGIEGQVHFVGFREDRLDFLRGFGALVLPSSLEGIPRCLMEAMAAGVPIVGTRIPGIADLISEQQTGLAFDVGDADSLAQCLRNLAADRALANRLAESAKLRVTESFSASGMAQHYASLFIKMSGATRRAVPIPANA
jgi:glycosyltransferase involved in cell wall biosynthesis